MRKPPHARRYVRTSGSARLERTPVARGIGHEILMAGEAGGYGPPALVASAGRNKGDIGMGYGCPNTLSGGITAVRRTLGRALAVVAVAAAGIGVAACGGGDNGGTNGGSMRIGSVLPDSYDPVRFQSTEANQPLQLVYKGLVTYTDAEGLAGTKLIPCLAKAMPAVSPDRRTYTFKLRTGLKYSDGSPVRASDFEHTIKRLTLLGGPYSSFMSSIEGVDAYQKAKKENGDISGITSDDATGQIVVRLTAPDGKFLFALGLPAAAPTPAAKSPFKSSRTIPGIGPYTIKIDNPTRQFVLTKTLGFDIPGIAKGNLDKITVVKDTVPKMTQDVIDN